MISASSPSRSTRTHCEAIGDSAETLEPLEGVEQCSELRGGEQLAELLLVFVDTRLALSQGALPGRSEVQVLPAAVGRRALAYHEAAIFEAVDDCHHGGAVHIQRGGHLGLRDAGIGLDEPQSRRLLLRQAE